MLNASTPLKISIWSTFVPQRAVVARDPQSNDIQTLILENFQEEVYTWQAPEPPFDGIADEVVRRRLQEHLFGKLHASQPPEQRGVNVLEEFILKAEDAITSGKSEWTPIQDQSEDGEDATGQINALLALTLHLKWLSKCFAHRPGISVTVR